VTKGRRFRPPTQPHSRARPARRHRRRGRRSDHRPDTEWSGRPGKRCGVMQRPKVLIFGVAYQAEGTLAGVLERVRRGNAIAGVGAREIAFPPGAFD
jgi:hypothetical protein